MVRVATSPSRLNPLSLPSPRRSLTLTLFCDPTPLLPTSLSLYSLLTSSSLPLRVRVSLSRSSSLALSAPSPPLSTLWSTLRRALEPHPLPFTYFSAFFLSPRPFSIYLYTQPPFLPYVSFLSSYFLGPTPRHPSPNDRPVTHSPLEQGGSCGRWSTGTVWNKGFLWVVWTRDHAPYLDWKVSDLRAPCPSVPA